MPRDPVERLVEPYPSLKLASLLAERLCHDLGGTLGTVAGALELMADADEGVEAPEALSLACDASASLLARFRLLRGAWGLPADAMDRATLRGLLGGLPNRRVSVDIDGLAGASVIPGEAARILLNLTLLGAECLPDGGAVALSGDAANEVLVTIVGRRAAWPVGFGRLLADDRAAWAEIGATQDIARSLQAPLVALMAREAGLALTMLMPVGQIAGGGPPPLLLSCRRAA